jgi:aspartate/methionine/tyrosine aminotransferase
MSPSTGTRYPIAAVRERVRRHDGPVLDFAVGRHRDDPPPVVRDLIRAAGDTGALCPCSQDELDTFASAAAEMLERVYGVKVEPRAVLPVPGGRTAMSLLASTLIRPATTVAVVEPAYPAFLRVVSQLGAEVLSIPLDPECDFVPAAENVAAAARRNISLTALNFPNNPTGTVPSLDVLTDLLASLANSSVVFNDATYGPLTFDRAPWSLLAEVAPAFPGPRFLELHSLAKLYATGPLPVAFLVGEEELMDEVREFSEFAWSDQSSLSVRVATACLEDGARFDTMRQLYQDRVGRLFEVLVGLGFEPFPASSGMYVVARVPAAIGDRSTGDAGEASVALLEEFGVAVVPWEIQPHSYLRFSARYAVEDLEALGRLGRNGAIARR